MGSVSTHSIVCVFVESTTLPCLRYQRRAVVKPVLSVYVNPKMPDPPKRCRRYVAFQLEYYKALIDLPIHHDFLRNSVLIWEYARPFLDRWRSSMPVEAVYVSCFASVLSPPAAL